MATSSSVHLKERKQGIHIFSAGFFTFKPLKLPTLCNQKPSLENSDSPSIFPPPFQDPTMPEYPPIPQLPRLPPLIQLPPLPSLPTLPFLPPILGKNPEKKPEELSMEKKPSQEKVANPELVIPPMPQNPFLSPPILPPNPLQRASPFPPNPLQPPSPLFPPNPLQPPAIFPPNPLFPPPSP